jgi:hypothetical protein
MPKSYPGALGNAGNSRLWLVPVMGTSIYHPFSARIGENAA